MKFKYTMLASLVSTVLCSSIVLASGTKTTIDTSEKPPLTGSRGMKPNRDKWPLVRQKTVLPWGKMTPEHRPAPKNPIAIPD